MGLIRIRFSPPLVISDQDMQKAIDIILESLEDFDTVRYSPPWNWLGGGFISFYSQIPFIPDDEPHEL